MKQSTFKPLLKLFKELKPYLWQIVGAFVLSIGSVIIALLAPSFLSDLTDEITRGAATSSIDLTIIFNNGIVLASFYFASFVFNFIGNFLFTRVSQLYARDLRKAISEKINRLPLKYLDARQFGDTLSVLTNDVDQVGSSLHQGAGMALNSVLMLLGVLIAMFATSWPMALTVVATLPLMILFLLMVTKLAMPRFRKRQELLGEVNAVVEEQFSGQMVIKAFRAEKKMGEAFEKKNQALNKVMFSAQIFGGLMQPVNSFISYLAYAAVCIVGGLLMGTGFAGVTFGTITAFLVYANLFQSPLTQLGQVLNTFQMAGASAERVFALLDEKEVEDDSHLPLYFTGEKSKPVKGAVEFKDVVFGYDEGTPIVHGFSAKIEPGMKVAIVGPTGAGKTTIVNLLMRFYDIWSGKITIDGVDTAKMRRSEVRDLFGMVLQDTWVFEGTIRDNITYGKERVSDEKIREVLKESNLLHFVDTLPGGLDYVIEDESSISGGQKQLLTIARAMIDNASMLILDEATSNVDTRTEELIQEAMDRLTVGRTSFVIAHRLSTIKDADLILVLDHGNVVEQGTHESLLAKNGFYASLYNSQFSLE